MLDSPCLVSPVNEALYHHQIDRCLPLSGGLLASRLRQLRPSDSQNYIYYSTRNSACNFIIPGVNSAGKSSLRYTGAKLWNSLPNVIKDISDQSDFKHKVKSHLFSQLQQGEMSDSVYF